MCTLKNWDILEGVLFMDICCSVESGRISKEYAAMKMSNLLYNKAREINIEQYNKYKLINVIQKRIENIQYLLTDGRKGLSSYSKFDKDMYNIYKTKNEKFMNLLEIAKKEFNIEEKTASKIIGTKTNNKNLTVVFGEKISYTYTIPVSLSYFGNIDTHIESWSKLYIKLVSLLLEKYSDKIPKNKSFINAQKIDLGDEIHKNTIRKPVYINSKYYLEINLSAGDIVQRIGELLNMCQINSEDVIIKYKKNENRKKIGERMGKTNGNKSINEEQNEPINTGHSIYREQFKSVLLDEFKKGYRIDSPIEYSRFGAKFEVMYNKELNIPDKDANNIIRKCGILYKDRIYHTDILIGSEDREKMIDYIAKRFLNGEAIIYYKSIIDDFLCKLNVQCIDEVDALKIYLGYINDNNYYIHNDYIANGNYNEIDIIKKDIIDYVINKGSLFNYDDILEKFSSIPQSKVEKIIKTDEFINNGKNEYFHISLLSLSSEDIKDIEKTIMNLIEENGFTTGKALFDEIERKYTNIISHNNFLSHTGFRKVAQYKLRDKFFFNGNVISESSELSSDKVVLKFLKNKKSFTLKEIDELEKDLNTPIKFDTIYGSAIRVNRDNFISSSEITFNIDETDKLITKFIGESEYIATNKMSEFWRFPNIRQNTNKDIEYEWNKYLLENYVAKYSREYKLIYKKFNKKTVSSTIAKRNSKYETLEDIVIDVLEKSKRTFSGDTAIQYLYNGGYLSVKRYSDIEEILIKLKNKK